jgi:Flp pilus assembly protein TadG
VTRRRIKFQPTDDGPDKGSVMPMTTILVVFLMVGAWALVSATQQWSVRRDAHAVAAAAARAAAQGDPMALRSGGVIDDAAAVERAQAIIAVSGYSGDVSVNGATVTVTVTAGVGYAFPSPGFPANVHGSATAVAQRGVNGQEGG